MKTVDEKLSHIAHKWTRIARKVASAETQNELLWNQCVRQKERIKELEAELWRLRPKDNKWDWLLWTLHNPRVEYIVVDGPQDKRELRSESNRIRSMIHMFLYDHGWRVSEVEEDGKWSIKIYGRKPQ